MCILQLLFDHYSMTQIYSCYWNLWSWNSQNALLPSVWHMVLSNHSVWLQNTFLFYLFYFYFFKFLGSMAITLENIIHLETSLGIHLGYLNPACRDIFLDDHYIILKVVTNTVSKNKENIINPSLFCSHRVQNVWEPWMLLTIKHFLIYQ